jgi:predicted ATPase
MLGVVYASRRKTGGVPEALHEPLFARLRASPNVVPVAEAAAVIGRRVDRALLVAVLDLGEDEIDDVIDELEDAAVSVPYGAEHQAKCPSH